MDRYSRAQTLRGPQVHAVPENEKAYDAAGKKLPWGYETISSAAFADGDRASREPVEKGPFGRRTTRRGTSRSRSKTAEPERKEDVLKREQAMAEEAVFGTLGRKAGGREALGEVDPNAVAQQPTAALPKAELDGEATEVLLYGFGEDGQWSAIEFYERVSGGSILEDYDRAPPGQRGYDQVSRSYSRAASQKSLSRAAMKMKNRYAGGNHWIKVTFSSRSAADLAVARSPHVLRGHLVYAEFFQGRGPARDESVFASQAGAQITNDQLPPSFATQQAVDASPNGSSTITSATERQTPGPRREERHAPPPWGQVAAPTATNTTTSGTQHAARSGQQLTLRRPGTVRIEGAKAVKLLPAEQCLMPKQPKQSWSAWLGASELIGTTVPRREDGTFDFDKASLYWRWFHWLDSWLGTDFCGLKGDE